MIIKHEVKNQVRDFSDYIKRHSGDETIAYKTVQGNPIHLSLYYPKGYDCQNKYPVFVFVHGGGWTSHKIFTE